MGIGIGDPIDGKAYVIKTIIPATAGPWEANTPALDNGEGCFASSGTNIVLLKNRSYYFVTGRLSSLLHESDKFRISPITALKEKKVPEQIRSQSSKIISLW